MRMRSISKMAGLIALLFFEVATAKINEWKWSRLTEVTRCYKTANLTMHCQDYSYEESKKRVLVQELEIEAIDSYGVKRLYSYGKAIEGSLCQEHLAKIRKLLWRTDQVCVTASDEYPVLGKDVSYRWKSLETQRGKLIW